VRAGNGQAQEDTYRYNSDCSHIASVNGAACQILAPRPVDASGSPAARLHARYARAAELAENCLRSDCRTLNPSGDLLVDRRRAAVRQKQSQVAVERRCEFFATGPTSRTRTADRLLQSAPRVAISSRGRHRPQARRDGAGTSMAR
jgi:hypothetical protein